MVICGGPGQQTPNQGCPAHQRGAGQHGPVVPAPGEGEHLTPASISDLANDGTLSRALRPLPWPPPRCSPQTEQRSPLTCGPDSRLARPRGRSGSPGPGAQRRQPQRRRQVRPRPAAGARADPCLTLCPQAGWCSKMSCAQPCGAAASWPGGRGQTGPTNPDSLGAPGTSWKFRRPQGHCGSSASPPKLFLFLQEARLDSCP
ncbi:collagen alpha-2(I) chain-like isoform X1 [Cervus canadensis]|uniref:collagen alpha-2(I) chain-like isoform X1 n=1 Tax=Cervus canadensis TaxID=1574408 RepID=UPI001CA3076B|nr:collagen alpha-2(I) chain-like isoform X1 [Cervus canadensis]